MSAGPGLRVSTSPDEARATITLQAGTGNVITHDLIAAIDAALDRLAPIRPLRLLALEAAATRLPELERLYLEALMPTEDAREGVAAFLEKRLPNWTDR